MCRGGSREGGGGVLEHSTLDLKQQKLDQMRVSVLGGAGVCSGKVDPSSQTFSTRSGSRRAGGGGGRAVGGAGGLEGHAAEVRVPLFLPLAALEATQGQLDVSFSQLPYKCNLEEVASVGD